MEMILEDHLHTRQRGITAALPQPIDGHMEPLRTTEHRCQRVGDGQIVVVMGVEVEVGIGIALDHLAEILDALQGIHDAKGIRQHEAADADVAKGIHQLVDVEGRILHAVRPILEVKIDGESFRAGVLHLATDIIDMLLGFLLQL